MRHRKIDDLELAERARFNPTGVGKLHESRTRAWRLWRPVRRIIPTGAKVHASLYERMKRVPDYAPPLPNRFKWILSRVRSGWDSSIGRLVA